MKFIKIVSLITAMICIIINVQAQNYLTQSELISSGGEESTGANYSNFGVIGETFVSYPVIGGDYESSIGFLYVAGDIPVNIAEVLVKKSITVFPNPTKGELYFEDTKMNAKTIEIYSLFGVKVFESEYRSSISISEFSDGLYLVKVIGRNGMIIQSQKIIKN